MIRTFLSRRSIMTGSIGTRLFSDTNAILEKDGFCRRRDGSLIKRSTREPRRTTIQEHHTHFPQVPFSVTKSSIMAGPTYACANYGGTALSLKAALSRLAGLFIMAMHRFSDIR